jgi:type I restriction enzyme S subunit
MPYEWQIVTIADLGRVVTGKTPSTAKQNLWGRGYPFITPTDIGNERYCETSRQLSQEGHASQSKLLLPEKSICVTCIASVGKMCVTHQPSFTNQQINSIIVDESRFDPFFVFYLLQNEVDRLKAIAGGVATPIINKTAFSKLKCRVPALTVQKRISEILSAYDELIENSQRRIKILETMARNLYREWFVQYRFPGHEKYPLIPSSLGEIPKGWEVATLAKLCSRMESGGTPKRSNSNYWEEGDIDWYKTGELWDGFLFEAQEKITALGHQQSTARLFESGTILMAIYGSPTVGRMGILTSKASCNQAAIGLVAHKERISQTFLFFVLLGLREHFNGIAQGAAQQNISKEKVANALAVIPPREIVASFDALAEPLFKQVETISRQVQNLRKTRDLLLPRLLSGQIPLNTPTAEAA